MPGKPYTPSQVFNTAVHCAGSRECTVQRRGVNADSPAAAGEPLTRRQSTLLQRFPEAYHGTQLARSNRGLTTNQKVQFRPFAERNVRSYQEAGRLGSGVPRMQQCGGGARRSRSITV
jgi:hypothetical protein